MRNAWLSWFLPAILVVTALAGSSASAVCASDDLLPTILELLRDPDRELRSLALQQVRAGLEGPAITKTLVEVLPTLSTEAQADLLVALGVRGDKAARPVMVDALDSPAAEVRVAALRAAATLGDGADVPRLIRGLAAATEPERHAARSTLERLRGEGVEEAMVAATKQAKPQLQIQLIELLMAREATAGVPVLLAAVEARDAATRTAALTALGRLAGPEHVPDLVRLLLAADEPSVRETLERTVMFACQSIEAHDQQALPLLAAMVWAKEADKLVLLSPLGRIGGMAALQVVEVAIVSADPQRREAGVRALCNWPDASVAPQLFQLAREAPDRGQRIRAVRALMRVAVLPDDRSDAERLDLLTQALTLATRDEERLLALDRARAVRTVESLRFVVPYLDDAKFAETASATVVELAHHRNLRIPNQAEFDTALDAVIAASKNAQLVTRAEQYKKGETH